MQYLATYYDPNSTIPFTFSIYTTSAVILAVISIAKGNIKNLKKAEVLSDAVNGVISILSFLLLFYLTKCFPRYIVFPAQFIIPIIAIMLLGHFVCKDRLNLSG